MRNILFTIEYDGSRYQGLMRPGKADSAGTVSAKIMDAAPSPGYMLMHRLPILKPEPIWT